MTSAEAALRAMIGPSFSGQLLAAGDSEYDAARSVWNAMIDLRPALIARCRSAADVALCVRAAGELGAELAVRGGGHQVAGFAVSDGGLVIDLSCLRSVRVDPERRRAFAGGGALLGDLDRGTQAWGLAAPAGVISHTGLGGLALGGGVGWLCRKYGLTCDNLASVEIVTADGEVRIADPEQNGDIFWAIRGGGGNFGVVTRFELMLHELREVHMTQLAFPFDEAADVLHGYASLLAEAPDELVGALALRRAGGHFAIDGIAPDDPVVLANLVHSGAPRAAARTVAPAMRWAEPAAVRTRTIPFLTLQTMQDALHPHGLRDFMKSGYLERLDNAAVAALTDAAQGISGSGTQIEVVYLRGAIARAEEDASAFPNRQAGFSVNLVATWSDPADDERQVRWARNAYRALEPEFVGGYTNFLGDEQERVATIFGPAKLARLREIKRQHDPSNLFRRNLNIAPAQTPATSAGDQRGIEDAAAEGGLLRARFGVRQNIDPAPRM